MAATEDMEATVTITARGLLMPSLLLPLRLTPNLDTEAMVAMEAMVDTGVMEAMVATGEDMAATEDMEVMATITARGLLMPSLLLSLMLTPNPDTEAMVAMEAMVDTEDMEAMADTGEDMVDMEDTATTTERGLLMLRLVMEATVDTDMEAMVATAAMVVMVTVTDMAVDTVTTDKPSVEYPKLSRVQKLNLTQC